MAVPERTALIRACLRDGTGGTGGSPTAVVPDDDRLSDEDRRRVPVERGTSHAVFLRVHRRPRPEVRIRFFTSAGELPACGHGTVAALAFLASRAGAGAEAGPGAGAEYRATLRTSTRTFDGWAVRNGAHFSASFDPGPVGLRPPTAAERELALPPLGIAADGAAPGLRVAGVGRERLLVPVPSRAALAAVDPDLDGLRDACDRLGLLGAYVYSPPSPSGELAARMFAPSIGVPEDIANANSTACLAALLARRGTTRIAVDMGDAVGSPATVTATARIGPSGVRIRVGGAATAAGFRVAGCREA
ncbi:PhzF family phenazine biosynthesis protein [Streptomyces sp. NPDC056367]|uniref:PhzF family phenazine biosynthesis protein n=1 Tax=Streptomyces sp. NPDC056367 TaxID=3345797 RepID=UPI0035D79E90